MVKLIVFVTLVSCLTVNGSYLTRQLFRGDPFPDRKSDTPVPSNIVLNTITQQLDNFDSTNDQTWEQRYYSNDEFYEPGGPLFVFLAGEWDITPWRLTNSLMADLADELNGNIFYLEHRYYGESRPTPDTSTENLRFLTVEQALADTAHFVEFILADTPGAADSEVIVIGGHYSGSLAVWFRQQYPHLTTGAWASSSPLLALVNHQQYKEIAGAAYRRAGGNECYTVVENGFAAIEEFIATGRAGEVEEIFNTCDPIVSDSDVSIFVSLVSELFAVVPQVNHLYSLEGVCDLITNGTFEPDINRIARHVENVIEEFFQNDCIPSNYEGLVELDRETDWDAPANGFGIRPYTYQLCTQLGWFHSSNSRFQPFGSSFDDHWWYRTCEDIFGEDFNQENLDENIARFNNIFGALSPAVTNTIFVQGELDPWRSIGVQTNLNPSSPAIMVRGGSQGNDLGPIDEEEDSPALIEAKETISAIITEWVQNGSRVAAVNKK